MKINIKKCTEDTVEKVGGLYDKVTKYLTENINYPKWMYKEYPSVGYAREMTGRGCQYFVEADDKIVGAFVLNDDPSGNFQKAKWGIDLKDGEYLVIHALAIDETCSRRGIGKTVVKFCIDAAKEKGYKALRVDTVPENYPAKNLYLSCGFKCFGDYDLDRPYDFKFFTLFEYVL